MRSLALAIGLVFGAITAAPAQAPTLDEVLARAAKYVDDYEKKLHGIVAEETYIQNVIQTRGSSGIRNLPRINSEGRRLKSDLLLVKLPTEDTWLQFRDVFEVDRQPVRDRDRRLYKLFVEGTANARAKAQEIQQESARYNIGPVTRTINVPMIGLLFFARDVQSRVRYSQGTAGNVKRFDDLAVAENIWMIEFAEHGPGTMVRGQNDLDLPSHGRAWIDSTTGRILRTETTTEDTQIRAVIDVYYKAESGLDLLVPDEMRERYNVRATDARIDGKATYAKFRQFKVTTEEKTEKPKP